MKLPGRLRSSACSGQRCTRWERDVSRIREVEAESVAYVLLAHHGLTIGGSSFPYVAGWAATDRVLDIPRRQAPAVVGHLETGRADVLAFTGSRRRSGGRSDPTPSKNDSAGRSDAAQTSSASSRAAAP